MNIVKILSVILAFAMSLNAGFGDMLKSFIEPQKQTTQKTTTNSGEPTTFEMAGGLKDALKDGISGAVSQLGKEGGYLNNAEVKIPMPENLQKAETLIRKFGGDKYADELIESMNHAAEKAAPKTIDIFLDAIKELTFEDTKKILTGPENSATEYFKGETSAKLAQMILPIVKESMKESQTASYLEAFNGAYKSYAKPMIQNSKIGALASSFGAGDYIPSSDVELDQYITQKAMDGLFYMISEKEARIRSNPMLRNTDLMQKVFGYFD